LTKIKTLNISLDGDENTLRAIVEGAMLGEYSFDLYKSDKKKKKNLTLNIYTKNSKSDFETLQDEFIVSSSVANATNFTRDIVNTPPDDFTPLHMAKVAKKIAKDFELDCKIYDERYLVNEGYGAMSMVARASTHPPRLIHLTHKPKNAKTKLVIVGKGLTYDSGGLSLKPSDFMTTMKSDKSGGASVLGIMSTIKALNLDIEVHGIIGAVENMIGGDAYKPDDVLTAKNGTTIEVQNTDAEGRLVLADCLVYAQESIKDIDYLFDMATLTGACVVGLGDYTTGIMGHNSKIKHQLNFAGNRSGELTASLPFNRYLKKLLKSEIADICNIASSRYGGAITAGLFLDRFIEDRYKDRWIHIDIAGPAFVSKPWGYNPFGASGAGVRLICQFLRDINK
jgi:leucyl aminopeptidase